MTAGACARSGPGPCRSPSLPEAPEAGEAAVRVGAEEAAPAVAEAVEEEEAVEGEEAAVEARFRR